MWEHPTQTALGICDLMWFLSPEVNGIRSSDRSREEAALCIWEVMPVWECLQGSCPSFLPKSSPEKQPQAGSTAPRCTGSPGTQFPNVRLFTLKIITSES